MQQPRLHWDIGTAYDFFMSLKVLHEPDTWGLRGAWAAGVRSRLGAEHREFLKDAELFMSVPMEWLYSLEANGDEGKSAETALTQLATLTPAQCFEQLTFADSICRHHTELADRLTRIEAEGKYKSADITTFAKKFKEHGSARKRADRMLHWFVNKDAFGEQMLPALQAYFDVFFAEEAQRIQPFLVDGLARAQTIAQTHTFAELIETLTSGVRYGDQLTVSYQDAVLVPSFWGAPLLIHGGITAEQAYFLFPSRPSTASLVPGKVVPDAMHSALKALADPTRLKILRYLSAEPQTPTELANKLRLRPPTVIHHLHILRLAQLITIEIFDEGQRYTARHETITTTMNSLQTFLNSTGA